MKIYQVLTILLLSTTAFAQGGTVPKPFAADPAWKDVYAKIGAKQYGPAWDAFDSKLEAQCAPATAAAADTILIEYLAAAAGTSDLADLERAMKSVGKCVQKISTVPGRFHFLKGIVTLLDMDRVSAASDNQKIFAQLKATDPKEDLALKTQQMYIEGAVRVGEDGPKVMAKARQLSKLAITDATKAEAYLTHLMVYSVDLFKAGENSKLSKFGSWYGKYILRHNVVAVHTTAIDAASEAFIKKGNFDAVIALGELTSGAVEALNDNPTARKQLLQSGIWFQRSRAFTFTGKIKTGLKAISADTKNVKSSDKEDSMFLADLHAGKHELHRNLGQYSDAVKDIEKAIQLTTDAGNPNDMLAWRKLEQSVAYALAGDAAKAKAGFAAATAPAGWSGDQKTAYEMWKKVSMALSENTNGNFAAAEKLVRDAIAIQDRIMPDNFPQRSQVHLLLAATLRRKAELNKAYEAITAAEGFAAKSGNDTVFANFPIFLEKTIICNLKKDTSCAAQSHTRAVAALNNSEVKSEYSGLLDAWKSYGTYLTSNKPDEKEDAKKRVASAKSALGERYPEVMDLEAALSKVR